MCLSFNKYLYDIDKDEVAKKRKKPLPFSGPGGGGGGFIGGGGGGMDGKYCVLHRRQLLTKTL